MARLNYKAGEAFAREFILCGFRGTEAARRCGSALTNASAYSRRMLARPDVLMRIEEMERDLVSGFIYSKDEIVAELNKLAMFNARDCYDEDGMPLHIVDMPEHITANVAEVKHFANGAIREIKFSKTKLQALDGMMKFYNAYEEHQKAAGTGEIHIHIDEKDAQA